MKLHTPPQWNPWLRAATRGLILLGLVAAAASMRAADIYKADNADSLNLGTAWTNGAPPTAADVAVWDATVTAASTVNLGASTNWAGIRLEGAGGAVTITNAATTLSLGSAGIDTTAAAFPLNLGCPVIVSAPQNWNLVTILTVSGGLSGAAASGNDVTLTSGQLNIAGAGMTLSNLVLNSGTTLVPQTSSGRGVVALNGGMYYLNPPSGTIVYNDILVTAGSGIIRNNVSRQWYGNLTGSAPLTVQVRGNFMRWGGDNRGYSGTISLVTWNGNGGLRIENVNAVSATTAYEFSASGDAYMTLNAAGTASLGSLSGGSLAADTTGYLSTEGNRLIIGDLNTDTTFSGNIQGTAAGGIIKSGTGRLTLNHAVVASTYAGSTTISNGVLQIGSGGASGLLGLGNVTNYSKLVFNITGTQTFANAITGTGNITNIGTGKVALTGTNNCSGSTVVAAGELSISTVSQITGDCIVANSATLGAVSTAAGTMLTEGNVSFGSGCSYLFNVGTFGNPSGPMVTNTGTVTLNGNVAVNLSGTNFSLGTITLLRYASRSGAGSFVLGTKPGYISATLTDDTVNKELRLTINSITVGVDMTYRWVGDSVGNWDIGNSANQIWKIVGTGQTVNYIEGVAVLFDDTATGTTNINLTTTLNPGAVTVNNTNKTYTFGGPGALSGTNGLTKRGPGSLITTNAHSYTGATVIEAGTLKLAGEGAALGTGVVTNNGLLVIDIAGATTLPYTMPFYNTVFGTGGASIAGADQTNSIVEFEIADGIGGANPGNPYSGGTTLSNVYVRLNANPYNPATSRAAKSVGLGAGTITFLGESTLELEDWNGATPISDYSAGFTPAINVPAGCSATLRTAGRMWVASTVTGSGTLTLGVSGVRCEIGGDFSAFSGQIAVSPYAAGSTDFRPNSATGFPLAKVHLQTGLFAYSSAPSGSVLRFGELSSESGTTIGGGANAVWQVGALNTDATNAANITSANVSLIKEGTGTWTLTGINDYSGNTTVSNGVLALIADTGVSNSPTISLAAPGILDVSGRTDPTLWLGADINSQTLRGNGTVRGSLIVGSLGTVTPGFSIGTLTVTNAVTLGGTVVMELNRAGSPNSDRIVAPSVMAGGALTVTNIGTALQAGDSFQLFSTPVAGAFAALNVPTTDTVNGYTYTWINRLAIDGTLVVDTATSMINPNPPTIQFGVSGGMLNLAWPTNLGWILQTNSVSVADAGAWFPYTGSTSVTNVAIPVDPAQTNVFFRMIKP